jgi:hypothetical protein
VKCVSLLHNIIIDLEGTTHDPSVLQESLQIHCCRFGNTYVSGRSFNPSSKGEMDIRNAFKTYFNGRAGAIPLQNQYLH